MKKDKVQIGYISLFYVLNILNTYFITTTTLNRYVVSFTRSFVMELNAIIGNFAVLTITLFIGFLIIKKPKSRLRYMLILTFILNFLIFGLGLFTKYYQTVFSLSSFDIFRNPATKLALTMFYESMRELIVYYRIIVFIPFILLLVFYLTIKYNKLFEDYLENDIVIFKSNALNFMAVISGLIMSLSSLSFLYYKMEQSWQIDAEKSLYAVQNGGVYNYYLGELFGVNKKEFTEIDLSIYEKYNKNSSNYINYFGEEYGNELLLAEANNLIVDSSLEKLYLNGIFNDKNLILVHLESLNHFLLKEEGLLDENYLKTLKALLKESYVFDNFYTNVGLGNTSDAEFSVLTGLYTKGDSTIYWDYEYTKYEFQSLAKLFPNTYNKVSLHGDIKEFYNREDVHHNMLGFDKYYYYNENEEYFEETLNGFHLFSDLNHKIAEESPWISDIALIDWTKEVFNKDGKNFLYPIMIQPHVPYLYYEDNPYFTKEEAKVDKTTFRYLNYESYLEEFFKSFINSVEDFNNSVFIFYSDHGSSIPYNDVLTILGKTKEEMPMLEYEREMLKTLAFIYVPSDELNGDGVYKGLFKGSQPLVRSQVDLYRTIVELFGLETEHYYFGVNGLSKEHTFSIDTRTFSLINDEYYLVGKRISELSGLSEDNIFLFNDHYIHDPYQFFKYVMEFKKDMDEALKNNLFKDLKN